MEGPPLPPYHAVRDRVQWRDAEGRLYACACTNATRCATARTCALMFCVLPIAETRAALKNGAPPPEFPEPDDEVLLEDESGVAGASVAGGATTSRRVDAVQRAELRRAVCLVTWRAPKIVGAPIWLR